MGVNVRIRLVRVSTKGGTSMRGKFWRVCLPMALVVFGTLLIGARAQIGKVADGGKAEEFKAKTFDLKEKGRAAIKLTFSAGKEAILTVRSEKKTDIHLFVFDAAKKVVAKDDSPGPS